MNVESLTFQDYSSVQPETLVIYERPDFNLLNAAKSEQVQYLVLCDEGRRRFGLVAGVQDGMLKVPFSAPFSFISSFRKNNKVDSYQAAVAALLAYARADSSIRQIRFTLPPALYGENDVSHLANALFANGFHVEQVDLNYHYNLDQFDDNYAQSIDIKARQKLRASLNAGLSFEEVTDDAGVAEAYAVIKDNRSAKGYPLRLSLEDVRRTVGIIPADFFIVRDPLKPVAAAMVYHVAAGVVQVIYWGNVAGSDHLKPMNFLSFKVFEYYHACGCRIVDIGPATESSQPNVGLCDFKQGIGCVTTLKLTLGHSVARGPAT
jgi:hypothetical protein